MSRTTAVPAEEPAAPGSNEFWQQMRELGEANADVRKFKRKLEKVDVEMRRFTFAHMVPLGTQFYFRRTEDRARLQATWNEIVSRRARILKRLTAADDRLQNIKQNGQQEKKEVVKC